MCLLCRINPYKFSLHIVCGWGNKRFPFIHGRGRGEIFVKFEVVIIYLYNYLEQDLGYMYNMLYATHFHCLRLFCLM